MPSLNDLLAESMLFTAVAPATPESMDTSLPFRAPMPNPTSAADLRGAGRGPRLDEDTVRTNQIWRFDWDPANPGTFSDITIKSRGMGMDYRHAATAYERMEFRNVNVIREPGSQLVELILDQEHMLGAWHARLGHISPFSDRFKGTAKANPLWQLSTRIDHSMLVAFGYKLDSSRPSPLTMAECDAFGGNLIPALGQSSRGCDFIAGTGVGARVCVGPVRYIVVVELVLCKEHNDFVPGGLVGFARIQPHAMIWSNEDLARVEATIVMERPKHGMMHGQSMHSRHKALVVADTNETHELMGSIPAPIPYTDVLYDYYETEAAGAFEGREPRESDHPLQKSGEVTLADRRFTHTRRINGAVTRRSHLVSDDPDVVKMPRQGQFDNVHIAPRMRLSMDLPDSRGPIVVDDDVVMLNMCLHDCCHMHVRWSAFLTGAPVAGWKDGSPNVEPGAPAVPENQTVFASFPNEHTLRYRAVAETVAAGALTVVCHHGLAYAVDQWPSRAADVAIAVLHEGIGFLANLHQEPYWNGVANEEWSLFYFRIRYCGAPTGANEWQVLPRSKFDLETCMA